jgi:anaerobic selenocysteine-containing dehydrogenase
MNFGVAHGLDHIFSTLCLHDGPKRMGAEWTMGFPADLLSDLGRAHHILLLGCDPAESGWQQEGTLHQSLIEFSRKTKSTKVVSLSPHRGDLYAKMDRHLYIRPGSEPFFLLGMVHIIIKSQWGDQQYIKDYTADIAQLTDLLQQWDVVRCAEICGIEVSDFSGVALEFSRSAMGVVHPGLGTFQNENSALAAWAWMAVHMLTANALRPGGIYENMGAFDLQPFLTTLSMKDAPTSTATKQKLQLMQTPASAIPDSGVKALICLGEIPESLRRVSMSASLDEMDLVVACAQHPGWVTERADWILPTTHPLEEDDIFFHLNASLPCKAIPRSAALYEPPGECKPMDSILKELSGHLKTSWKGHWGYHLKGASRVILKADLIQWMERLIEFGVEENVPSDAGYRFLGETNRSLWRPLQDRLEFLPEALPEIIASLTPPETSERYPFLLHCSGKVDDAPDDAHRSKPLEAFVCVHPDTGIAEGSVQLDSPHGSMTVEVRHDDQMRADVVRAPAQRVPEIMGLLPDGFAAWTGAPILDGIPCQVQALPVKA